MGCQNCKEPIPGSGIILLAMGAISGTIIILIIMTLI